MIEKVSTGSRTPLVTARKKKEQKNAFSRDRVPVLFYMTSVNAVFI
jgi:hypothetical protein